MAEISFEEQCRLDEIRINQRAKTRRQILSLLNGYTYNEILEITNSLMWEVKALSTLNYEEDSQQK